jgi:hypothetical protein
MTGPMPTRDGDVVIAHGVSVRSIYVVWTVGEDREQEPSPAASAASARGREAAQALAARVARESHGAIFFHDLAAGRWTKLTG